MGGAELFILLSAFSLAYANGANDNFKGVATLFGSGITNYWRALWFATGMTFLGSLAAIRDPRDRRIADGDAGLNHPCQLRRPLWHWSGKRHSPMEDDWRDSPCMDHHPACGRSACGIHESDHFSLTDMSD